MWYTYFQNMHSQNTYRIKERTYRGEAENMQKNCRLSALQGEASEHGMYITCMIKQ